MLAGASGLVGGWLLRELRQCPGPGGEARYREVVVLTRRPLGVDSPAGAGRAAVRELVVDFEALARQPDRGPWAEARVDHIYCALGTTIRKAGSQDRFRRVDHDYPVALGRVGQAAGARSFGLVSSVGADAGSRNFYLRTKGEAEAALAALALPDLSIVRPSIIGGRREEVRPGEWLGKQLGKLIPGRYRTVHPAAIAIALARLVAGETCADCTVVPGSGGGRVRILESEGIRRMVPRSYSRRRISSS
jgi:uncharacterized protein YbjT (DUF2867 family)